MAEEMNMMEFFRQRMRDQQMDRLERYRVLNRFAKKGEILFTGSSLMEQFPINELLMSNGMTQVIYNRGVGGFTTTDMLEYMEEMIFGTEPSRIFINIGTNDIGSPDYQLEALMANYEKILVQTKERLPKAQITLMAYYPVKEVDKVPDNEWGAHMLHTRTNANIDIANAAVKELAEKLGCRFIDVSDGLRDENGRLKAEFTIEGIHMYASGYQVVLENLKKYL
mgnify:CR=1 FL=1